MFKQTGSLTASTGLRHLSDDEKRIIDDFHKLYYNLWEERRCSLDLHYLGFPMIKNPLDLWAYQEIITETMPGLLVEAGTLWGGSALYFASLFELIGSGEIVTIDVGGPDSVIDDTTGKTVGEIRPQHPLITYHHGSSIDDDTVDMVAQRGRNKRIMVILDSNHTKEHVLAEMRLYAPLVSNGLYMVVEDSNVHGHPVAEEHPPGPYEAVEEFLKENDDFVIDTDRERFLFTCAPHGFLRKVKESWTPEQVLCKTEEALKEGDVAAAVRTLHRGFCKYPHESELAESLALLKKKLES